MSELSLLKTIEAYRRGLERFNSKASMTENDEEFNSLAEQTYQQHMRVLDAWPTPATSHEEAIAALEMALKEAEAFHCCEMVVPMMKAVHGYLKGLQQN